MQSGLLSCLFLDLKFVFVTTGKTPPNMEVIEEFPVNIVVSRDFARNSPGQGSSGPILVLNRTLILSRNTQEFLVIFKGLVLLYISPSNVFHETVVTSILPILSGHF